MENNNIINNNEEVKPKRVYTEAQIKAVKAYRERNRDSEEYKQRQRVNSKKSYEKNREKVIARVRATHLLCNRSRRPQEVYFPHTSLAQCWGTLESNQSES